MVSLKGGEIVGDDEDVVDDGGWMRGIEGCTFVVFCFDGVFEAFGESEGATGETLWCVDDNIGESGVNGDLDAKVAEGDACEGG